MFIYSFIWVTVPSAIFFIPDMYEERVGAGKNLSTYSVSVRGYYRKDGTYVRPHSRRPPGSVSHDAPYFTTRSRLFWGMAGLSLLSIVSTGSLVFFSAKEYRERRKNFNEFIESEIISKMNTDFSDLANKPRHLINRLISMYDTNKVYHCMNCHRSIERHEFHYSSRASRNPSKTCIDCMLKKKEKYEAELAYVWYFEKKLSEFLEKFERMNQKYYPKHMLETKNIEKYFYDSVKETREKTEKYKRF